MIRAERVTFARHGRPILREIDFDLRPGELTVLAGPNGAGKSTLLKLLTGEIEPVAGVVRLDDVPLAGLSPKDLARRRAVLPQASELAFPFTVSEIVGFGLEAGGRTLDPASVRAALARVELCDFGSRLYDELSGGERQRVHLARVLAQIGPGAQPGGPRFLFLDEPVSSLDIRHQLTVLRIARDHARAGCGVLAVLHDLNLACGFADRLVVLCGGRIAADGPPAETLSDDLVARVFGVPLRVGAVPPAAIPFILPQTAA